MQKLCDDVLALSAPSNEFMQICSFGESKAYACAPLHPIPFTFRFLRLYEYMFLFESSYRKRCFKVLHTVAAKLTEQSWVQRILINLLIWLVKIITVTILVIETAAAVVVVAATATPITNTLRIAAKVVVAVEWNVISFIVYRRCLYYCTALHLHSRLCYPSVFPHLLGSGFVSALNFTRACKFEFKNNVYNIYLYAPRKEI